MSHNAFDLELHARFARERAMDEVARARRVDEAQRGEGYEGGWKFHLPAAVNAVRAWFKPSSSRGERRPGRSVAERLGSISIEPAEPPRGARPLHPAANPYAGMVIVARGEAKRIGRSSACNVKEC
jgi:hypothetical protein